MAEEVDKESKTEDPTPRRREEARKLGQVPFSPELVGGVLLLAGMIGLSTMGRSIGGTMLDVFRTDLVRLVAEDFGPAEATALMARATVRALYAMLPLFGLLLVVGIAASVVQVGFQVTPERMEVNFDKLNPVTGAGRLFSSAAAVKGLITLLKVAGLAGMAYWVVEGRLGQLYGVTHDRLAGAVGTAWALTVRLALYLAGAIAAVGLIDYIFQRRRFEASLRMTKQELKEELKQEEGDPQLKARMRQLARERARRKMLAEVPKSTVVVTNPTHVACALRYDTAQDAAPVLVAKGAGAFARRIAEVATQAGVLVLERPELARAIYTGVKEGQAVPGPLFRAVAEVIAFVYRLRGITAGVR